MLQSLVAQMGAAAVLVVCLYALYAGSWRERFGAVVYLIAYMLTMGFGLIAKEYTTLYLLVADTLCLQAFYVLSWKSLHPWPKWAVAGQLTCVVAEVATLFKIGISSHYFLTLEIAAGWAVLMALLLGTIAMAQARRDARRQSLPK